MPATVREPKEIVFEDKTFDFYSDNDNYPQFDFYLLKSKPNVLRFVFEDHEVKIYSSKFPTGKYGCGYWIDSRILIADDETNGKCYATGVGGSRSFDTEFDAVLFIINHVIKNSLVFHNYYAKNIRQRLTDYINPKTLF